MNIYYHNHHIVPKHLGGTNEQSNLITLTVAEHAAWHYELWVYYGLWEDWLAWKGLSKQITTQEIMIYRNKENGAKRKGISQSKEHQIKRGIFRKGEKSPLFGRKLTYVSENNKKRTKERVTKSCPVCLQSFTYPIYLLRTCCSRGCSNRYRVTNSFL